MNKITEKHNKYGQYFLVDLTFSYYTPKEVMESGAGEEPPEGQLSIDEVESENNETADDEEVKDLPF